MGEYWSIERNQAVTGRTDCTPNRPYQRSGLKLGRQRLYQLHHYSITPLNILKISTVNILTTHRITVKLGQRVTALPSAFISTSATFLCKYVPSKTSRLHQELEIFCIKTRNTNSKAASGTGLVLANRGISLSAHQYRELTLMKLCLTMVQ